MQFLTRYRMYWHGAWVEGGNVIEADSPADDAILAHWQRLTALVPYEPSPSDNGGEDSGEPPGEAPQPHHRGDAIVASGGTPAMSTAERPAHVGRRTRPS